MGPAGLRKALLLLGVFLVLVFPEVSSGRSYFGYRLREGYYEGVWSERPISGVDLHLVSVCAVVDEREVARSDAVPGYLHLAFEISEELEDVDIAIRGPGNYLLDRVDRDFKQGLNVFTWESRVVDGLGIHVEELEPVVSMVGGVYIPCFVSQAKPTTMPRIEAYMVSFQANTEGAIKYFVRDGGKLVVEDRIRVSANVPAEVRLPVTITSDHMDLVALLEYETDGVPRTLRQFFPIKATHAESDAVRGD